MNRHGNVIDLQQPVNEQTLDEEDEDDLPTGDDIVHTALCVECRHGRIVRVHAADPATGRLPGIDLGNRSKLCSDLRLAGDHRRLLAAAG